jgi:hypothetical protein
VAAADLQTQAVSGHELTCAEVANILGVSRRQANNLAGPLGAERRAGRWWFSSRAVYLELSDRRDKELTA